MLWASGLRMPSVSAVLFQSKPRGRCGDAVRDAHDDDTGSWWCFEVYKAHLNGHCPTSTINLEHNHHSLQHILPPSILTMQLRTILALALPLLGLSRATPIPMEDEARSLDERGFGKMTIPLWIASLPKNMTFTITDITPVQPKGMTAFYNLGRGVKLPISITGDAVSTALANKNTPYGVSVGEFSLMTGNSGFGGGQGGSFNIKFNIAGLPPAAASANLPAQNINGQLTIATSEWGFFARPDQTIFTWTVGSGGSGTYSAKTKTLTYLDTTVLAVAYLPDTTQYVFGLTNTQTTIVKIAQAMVGGIIEGHKALWSYGAGLVVGIGGTVFSVVAWAASSLNGQ